MDAGAISEFLQRVEKSMLRIDRSGVTELMLARLREFRQEIPYDQGSAGRTFKYQVADSLPSTLRQNIPDFTYHNMYDLCIQFRVDKAVAEAAGQCVDNAYWKEGRRRVKTLHEALKGYRNLEGPILRQLGKPQQPSATQKAVTKLTSRIAGLERRLDAWEEAVSDSTITRRYNKLVLQCDRMLRSRIGTRRGRARVISAALKKSRARLDATDESVEKLLQRAGVYAGGDGGRHGSTRARAT